MSRRNRVQDLSTAELRVLGQRVLARQADEVPLEELQEFARLMGARLVQVDADPRRPHDEPLEREKKQPEKTPAQMQKLYEDELLETNARKLGLKMTVR